MRTVRQATISLVFPLRASCSRSRRRQRSRSPALWVRPAPPRASAASQLPAPDPKFGGVIKNNALQSKPWWAPRVVLPKGAPNVLLIITDDAGFGVISEQSTGFPGYNSIIAKDKATIGRILLENGYAISWFGKDHNVASLRGQPGRTLRAVADRHGLRLFLRLRGRRRQPVAAEPLPQHHADLSFPGQVRVWNLVTAMAGDAIDYVNRIAPDPAGQADLHQVRTRRHPCAAPPDEGMGGQDQPDEALR